MGIVDVIARFLGRANPPRTILLKGDGAYALDVVRESHHQDALAQICGGKTEERADHRCAASLLLDDTNAFDNYAVAVGINGQRVGHLAGPFARLYRAALADIQATQANVGCRAKVVGGWLREDGDEGSYGVKLDVAWPLQIEASL